MHGSVDRMLLDTLIQKMKQAPVVAILGPRQCGKTTLAGMFAEQQENMVMLDLERPADIRKLEDPEAFFMQNAEAVICIDEIQRRPDLFPVIRFVSDRNKRPGQFLILGSASRELIRQSSESLAGRISYLELTPFLITEIPHPISYPEYQIRGGFPRSFLARTSRESFEWRLDFIRDFIERDIPSLSPRTSPQSMNRLLVMIAHSHGQLLNMNNIAKSMGKDSKTILKHLDLLEGAFVIRRLQPYFGNLKKRLVKSPKIYIRDTGILHALLQISEWNDLAGHPVYGFSWESMCIENIISRLKPEVRFSFLRTSNGAEVDLVLETGHDISCIEFKVSTAPKAEKGFYIAREDIGATDSWVLAPIRDGWESNKTRYANLNEFLTHPENSRFLL